MAHFKVIVISKYEKQPETPEEFEKMACELVNQILPYSSDFPVEEKIAYFDDDQIENMYKEYNIEKSPYGSKSGLYLEHLKRNPGFNGGLDKEGRFYYKYNYNPNAKFDNYGPIACLKCSELLEEMDFHPLAIITPDGKWIESEVWTYFEPEYGEEKVKMDEWKDTYLSILKNHSQNVCTVYDCHV